MLALFFALGPSWPHFARLAAFFVALDKFLYFLGPPGLDFGRLRAALGTVFEAQNGDFSGFLRAHKAALRKRSDPYKTLAGATKIYVLHISHALSASHTIVKNRSGSLSNNVSHEDRLKNCSSGSLGYILEVSGALLAGSWPSLACF